MFGLMLKRSVRDLKKSAGKYLALVFLIFFSVFLVMSLMGSASSIMAQGDDYDRDFRVEDGEFTVFVPLTQAELEVITSKGVEIEKMFSMEYELSDGSTLRVFKERQNINLITLHEGAMPANDSEAVLERRYSEEHGIHAGDQITLGDKTFTVSGIGAAPDYNSTLRTLGDTSVDSVAFGLIFVTDNAYEELLASGNSLGSEEYCYAYMLNGAMTDDELKAILEENRFDVDAIDDPYFLEYWNDMVGRKDDLLEGIDDLNEGAEELRDSVDELYDGVGELNDGVDELEDAMPDLVSGADDLNDGAGQLESGIGSYTDAVSSAASGARELSDGMDELEDGANELVSGSDQYAAAVSQLDQQVGAMTQSEDPYVAGVAGPIYQGTSALNSGYDQIDQGIDAVAGGVSSAADGAEQLADGLEEISSNSDALTGGASALHNGTRELSDGVEDLSDGVTELSDGVDELYDGTGELRDGVIEYADGMNEFADEANDLIDEVFDIETENLMMFLPKSENVRIHAAADDVQTTFISSMVVGVIALILFAYVISVFVVHNVDQESSIIGALYSLGVKRSSITAGYLMMPVLITFISGLAGTLVALYTSFGIPNQMKDSFGYFSMPDMEVRITPFLYIYGLVMPALIALLVNVLVIRNRLMRTPLSLLRNEQKAVKARDIKIKHLGFINTFRIRQLLREMRSGLTVIFGMFLALLVVMLAINTSIYCLRVKNDNVAYTNFEYMYTYKYPEKEVPEGGYEAVAESMKKDFGGYMFDITLMGITRDNPFFESDLLTDSSSEVVVSKAFAYKYQLDVGDEFTLQNKKGDKLYAFKIVGLSDYQASMMVFMDIDACRDLLGEKDDYFNCVFSDRPLDIDSGRLYSTLSKRDISSAASVFVDQMKSMVYTLVIAGAVIFCVVMYLMIKMMIDRSAFNISLVKIFGFKSREVKKMYLDGNFWTIALGALICIPLCKLILNYIYPNYLVANVAVGVSQGFPPQIYAAVFGGILLLYLVISGVLFVSIKRATPAVVLKNRE